MKRSQVTITITAALGVLGALAVAPATASAHPCWKHAKGAKIVTKTREAHVIIKRKRWYGCASKFGRIRRLPGLDDTESIRFDDGRVPGDFELSGQFVAYEQFTLSPAGVETQSDVYIYNLGSGKTEYNSIAGSSQPPNKDSVLDRLVIKRNGSAAWSARIGSGSDATYEVHRWSKRADVPGRVTMDAGRDLDPDSLRMSRDRRTISWVRGDQTKTAELP